MPFRNYNVQLHFDGEILPAKIYYDKEKSCPEGVSFEMGTVPSTYVAHSEWAHGTVFKIVFM